MSTYLPLVGTTLTVVLFAIPDDGKALIRVPGLMVYMPGGLKAVENASWRLLLGDLGPRGFQARGALRFDSLPAQTVRKLFFPREVQYTAGDVAALRLIPEGRPLWLEHVSVEALTASGRS